MNTLVFMAMKQTLIDIPKLLMCNFVVLVWQLHKYTVSVGSSMTSATSVRVRKAYK